MLWLAILLFVAWVLGFAVFKIAGGLIHLLLILAVVVLVYRMVTGRRVVYLPLPCIPTAALAISRFPKVERATT